MATHTQDSQAIRAVAGRSLLAVQVVGAEADLSDRLWTSSRLLVSSYLLRSKRLLGSSRLLMRGRLVLSQRLLLRDCFLATLCRGPLFRDADVLAQLSDILASRKKLGHGL